MIKIRNLSKSYGSNKVLKDINLELSKGKIFGFVGENGSGKTSFFKCIAGLEEYSGDIDSEDQPLKNHVGLLLTEPYFISKLTAREYLTMMCNARGKNNKELDKKNIFDLPLDRYASQYSTGMKKKLAIFAILLQGNDYLILDEPYNGVDIQSNFIISELIKTLKKSGKTILISSHVISSLKDICDEIFILEEGEINQSYNKEEFDLIDSKMNKSGFSDKISSLGLI